MKGLKILLAISIWGTSLTAMATTSSGIIEQSLSESQFPNAYVQTPMGGRPGSSDMARPSFAELAIYRLPITIDAISWQRGPFKPYFNYHHIQQQTHLTLNQNLLTYSKHFTKNSPFAAAIKMDWRALGLTRLFEIGRFKLRPLIDIAIFDFDYHIKVAQFNKSRAYRHASPRLGFELDYCLRSTICLHLQAAQSLPLGNLMIKNYSMSLELKQPQGPSLAIGQQWEIIDYLDKQTFPNHIYLNTGMMPFVSSLSSFEFI